MAFYNQNKRPSQNQRPREKREEVVRQYYLELLKGPLGFPPSLIITETPIDKVLAHGPLSGRPNRRLDILCYAFWQGEITPLLLVECKQGKYDVQKAWDQLRGYNHYIRAPWIGVADEEGILLHHLAHVHRAIPPYVDCLNQVFI